MKRSFWLSFCSFTAVMLAAVSVHAEESPPPPPETDQLLVIFEGQPSDQTEEAFDLTPASVTSAETIMTADIPQGTAIEDAIETLESQPGVVSVEPDQLIPLQYTPNDPLVPNQWHIPKIRLENAWNVTKGSSSVVVAVIDNGIDLQHPDFSNQLVSPYDAVTRSTDPADMPPGLHGTHVAGIVASRADNNAYGSGVAPGVKIMPVNVFYGEYAYMSDLITGIDYAVANGADIINMSLGSAYYSAALDAAVQRAHSEGLVVIAAAGNSGSSWPFYPASYPNVISVAATTSTDDTAWFSNYGQYIDLAAPGVDIYSTFPYNDFGPLSGTSMASPVAAGVAALILSTDPSLTNKQVEQFLYQSADDLGTKGRDDFFGHGRVNAERAVSFKSVAPPKVNPVSDQSTSITGTAATGTVIEATVGSASYKTTAKNNAFTLAIPKQKAGTVIKVTATNQQGVKSKVVTITVADKTPPAAPKVSEVSNLLTVISGVGEANAKAVATINGKTYSATINAKNNFAITIPKQKAGTKISVLVQDKAGNKSKTVTITVTDKAAPAPPKVNQITDSAKTVKGKTEASAAVEVKIGRLSYKGKAKADGSFSVTIPKQGAGVTVSVTSTDAAGNKSKATVVKVVDKTPPSISVSPVKHSSTTIKGKAENGATITVKAGSRTIATGKASKGQFSLPISKQKKGTKLIVTAKDAAGNTSKAVTITVQ